MIEVRGLFKSFGEVQALSDVSFTVQKGHIVGFLGANGAGKTTTMDIMCGCVGADQGSVTVAGFDITESPIEAKKRLGYLPDVPPLHPEMRVSEHVTYAARLHGIPKSETKSRVDETLDRLSLTEVHRRLVGNLSKGYRQRVALAQALVHNPAVLVLDEPTEGLDPNQIVHIRELIRSLAGEHTIILSSHILSEVQNTCDSLVFIHGGKIIQEGRYEDIVAKAQSERTYRVRVAKNARDAAVALRSVSGIKETSALNDHELQIDLINDSEAALDDVATTVVNGGYGLRELSIKSQSLEDVFLTLTH